MDIYVVQPNDKIEDIARQFGVSAEKLIKDNVLKNPDQLVPGQTIVIAYPEQTYMVKDDETLQDISKSFHVPLMQLLRNNPFLSDREPYPGEVITISYNTIGKLATNGFAYPFIGTDILKKTLPSLTYITVYNYKATETGELLYYYDDSNIIQTAKDYGTVPLMMLTSYSLRGEPNPVAAENILSIYEYQEKFINNIIRVVMLKGYLGINFYFDYISIDNIEQHLIFIRNINKNLKSRKLLFFVTLDPNAVNQLPFESVDSSMIVNYVNNISFLQFIWGINYEPPGPTNSIDEMKAFIDFATTAIPPDKITAGYSLISYNWTLPYIPGLSYANSLSINESLSLAGSTDSTIQFDEDSQAPFFTYYFYAEQERHIVWTIDARSISALVNLIIESGLDGASFWNVMYYYAQLWLVINSQLQVVKLLPGNPFDVVI